MFNYLWMGLYQIHYIQHLLVSVFYTFISSESLLCFSARSSGHFNSFQLTLFFIWLVRCILKSLESGNFGHDSYLFSLACKRHGINKKLNTDQNFNPLFKISCLRNQKSSVWLGSGKKEVVLIWVKLQKLRKSHSHQTRNNPPLLLPPLVIHWLCFYNTLIWVLSCSTLLSYCSLLGC